MAVSNTFTWDLTRDQIITESLRIAGALGDWEAATTNQITNAAPTLESIIKAKQTIGMPLWLTKEANIACSSFVDGRIVPSGAKVMKLLQAFLIDASNSNFRRELAILDRQSFLRSDASQLEAQPNAIHLHPLNDTSEIWLSPRPDSYSNTNLTVNIHYQSEIDDAGISTNNINFPREWLLVIQYELANVLAAKYGTAASERNMIARELEYWRKMTESFDVEEGSIWVRPSRG